MALAWALCLEQVVFLNTPQRAKRRLEARMIDSDIPGRTTSFICFLDIDLATAREATSERVYIVSPPIFVLRRSQGFDQDRLDPEKF